MEFTRGLMMKKLYIYVLIITSLSSYAHASSLIQDLSSCNSTFFQSAKNNKALSSVIDEFYKNGIIEGEHKTAINFSDSGVNVNSLNFVYTNFDKYQNSIPDAPSGKYYFWGFESEQPIKNIAEMLSQKINLMKINDDSYIYKPEYRNSLKDHWIENKSALKGIAPDKDSAERLFILESNNEGGTNIYCTIQGMIDDNDLHKAGLIK